MYGVLNYIGTFSVCRPTNLYKAEDLSTFTPSGNVKIDVCTADTLAQLMMDRASKKVRVCLLIFVDK